MKVGSFEEKIILSCFSRIDSEFIDSKYRLNKFNNNFNLMKNKVQ
jgi:hypothetical protein